MMPALLISMCSGRPLERNSLANESMELGSSKSILPCSTLGIPLRAWRALSGVRAGTTTVAPASVRARVVSRPIPAYPPVTTTTLPRRSMPASTSRAVVVGPKPECIGVCLLGIVKGCSSGDFKTSATINSLLVVRLISASQLAWIRRLVGSRSCVELPSA
jgi:hypothetical protein